MTIQKITTDKYLYQGRIVDLAFLQAKKTELEEMIAVHEKIIKEVKLIELIPQIQEVPEYVEAAELYNTEIQHKSIQLEQEIIDYKLEITEINGIS